MRSSWYLSNALIRFCKILLVHNIRFSCLIVLKIYIENCALGRMFKWFCPTYNHGLILVQPWIIICIHSNMWDDTVYPMQSVNGTALWVRDKNSSPHLWLLTHAGIKAHSCEYNMPLSNILRANEISQGDETGYISTAHKFLIPLTYTPMTPAYIIKPFNLYCHF